jgi:hypothetical protein
VRYVEKYCIAVQAIDASMARALCMLDTKVCKYTGRICNIPYLMLFYCNSSCTNVSQCYVYTVSLVGNVSYKR